ncbi:MAG: cyclic nucleotide-binding domain-containing protein [Oligoflexales bacterium]|nr:cyclic nucleotide-binding domain-containing protein [Oligoflexales bacterium]
MAIVDIVKSCPIFFELYDDEIEKVLKDCKVHTYNDGDYIVKEGDKGKEIYIMLAGTAFMQRKVGNKTVNIETLKHSSVFGYFVLTEEQTYTSDIVASGSADVLSIPYDHLLGFFRTNPGIVAVIALNLTRMMAQRMDALRESIFEKTKALENVTDSIRRHKKVSGE